MHFPKLSANQETKANAKPAVDKKFWTWGGSWTWRSILFEL